VEAVYQSPDFPPSLAVYRRGTDGAFVRLGECTLASPPNAAPRFELVAGQQYFFMLGTFEEPPGGDLTFTLRVAPALAASRLFFVSARDGNQELYVMRGDGSGPTNLTNHAAHDFGPALSANGERIAFFSTRGTGQVFVMDGDGSHLSEVAPGFEQPRNLAISADGRQVAFDAFFPDVGRREIVVMPVDPPGAPPARLHFAVNNVAPVFSPDGSILAYVCGEDLCVQGVDDPLPTLISGSDFSFEPSWPAWSPDGRRVAHVWEGNLFWAHADGTGSNRLTDTRRPESDPAWSPDGTKLAFVRNTSGVEGYRDLGAEVIVLDLASGQEVNVSNSEADDRGPVWSPDGEWLAFTSDRDEDEEIYAVRADGSGLTRLTHSPGQDEVAAWR
jgi:TolB protein